MIIAYCTITFIERIQTVVLKLAGASARIEYLAPLNRRRKYLQLSPKNLFINDFELTWLLPAIKNQLEFEGMSGVNEMTIIDAVYLLACDRIMERRGKK